MDDEKCPFCKAEWTRYLVVLPGEKYKKIEKIKGNEAEGKRYLESRKNLMVYLTSNQNGRNRY